MEGATTSRRPAQRVTRNTAALLTRVVCISWSPTMKRLDWTRIALRGGFALTLVLTSACGTRDELRTEASEIVRAREVARVASRMPGLWSETGGGWLPVLEATIGRVEGNGPDVFAAISGLEVGGDGTLYVLDRITSELRAFRPSGQHVRTVGRVGQGPGEYQSPAGLLWASEDTLVVADQMGMRYSLLHDMEHVRSVNRQQFVGTRVFRGGIRQRRIYELDPFRQPPMVAGSPLDPSDPSQGRDSLFLPALGPLPEQQRVRARGGTVAASIPFAPTMVYHLDRRGQLWYGHGSEFRIFNATWDGELIAELSLDAPGTPVTDEDVSTRLAQIEGSAFGRAGGRIDRSLIPAIKPYFTGMYLDPENNLWVAVQPPQGGARYAVFDPLVRFLGYVTLEDVGDVSAMDPVISSPW